MGRALVLLVCCTHALALNPDLDISQYAHKSWTIRDGFFKGRIEAITQTPDGYLWLGTEFGLLRFDGVRTTPWAAPNGEQLRSNNIRSLYTSRDGTLWIGTANELVSWKDGKLTQYPEFNGRGMSQIFQDREGSIWVSGYESNKGRICAIREGVVRCYGENGEFGNGASAFFEDASGNLWVGVKGLWRWKPDPPKFCAIPGLRNGIDAIADGGNGSLLLSTDFGVQRFVDGTLEPYTLPDARPGYRGRALLRDRDGGLWIGTDREGIFHQHHGRTDGFALSDGLSGSDGHAFFEDREGNIWSVTQKGLDRFREFAVPTFSESQGLSGTSFNALAAGDGSVWVSTNDGLKRWHDGVFASYRPQRRASRAEQTPGNEVFDAAVPERPTSLFEDSRGRIGVASFGGLGRFENDHFVPVRGFPDGNVMSIGEDMAGSLWVSNQNRGLIRLSTEGTVQVFPWNNIVPSRTAICIAVEPKGGLWLGFYPDGMAYFKDGQVRHIYSTADGLGKGLVKNIRIGGDGAVWAATEGGLSRLMDGRFSTLSSKDGLPCDTVHWSIEDNDHSFWIYTACGLVRIGAAELSAWSQSHKAVHPMVLDSSDGVNTVAISGYYTPQVSKAPDGRLWFSAGAEGVSVIDARHLVSNKLAPPVHVEQIIADRKMYPTNVALKLPALTRDLQIGYTALSLVEPEKNQFRYKLEGHDRDWQDAGTRRQAFYNDLPPRRYRFRVMASNNSGVWNEAGASFNFAIAPAYYQTIWFYLLCGTVSLVMLAALYLLRQRQMARRFNILMEGRLAERSRIARDFHDTLLQSFQGVVLKFYAVACKLPDQSPARTELEEVIEQARAAITEGRDTVQGLRSSTVQSNNLARAIGAVAEELKNESENSIEFQLLVEGPSRELAPLVRDETYRIACEALRNAFRHSKAKRIEVDIRYAPRQLQLRIRDDGKGIDPAVLAAGERAGHHGLPGMHERAAIAGGKLEVRSRLDLGTEIELTIPAAVAYASSQVAKGQASN